MNSSSFFLFRLIATLAALNFLLPNLNHTFDALNSAQSGALRVDQEVFVNSFDDQPRAASRSNAPNISDVLAVFGSALSGNLSAEQETWVNSFDVNQDVSSRLSAAPAGFVAKITRFFANHNSESSQEIREFFSTPDLG